MTTTPKPYRQIPLSQQRYELILFAVLRHEPPELERMLGITFEESCDDLDYLSGALLETEQGSQYALIRHKGAPSPGTELCIHTAEAHFPVEDLLLEGILSQLNFTKDDCSWIHYRNT